MNINDYMIHNINLRCANKSDLDKRIIWSHKDFDVVDGYMKEYCWFDGEYYDICSSCESLSIEYYNFLKSQRLINQALNYHSEMIRELTISQRKLENNMNEIRNQSTILNNSAILNHTTSQPINISHQLNNHASPDKYSSNSLDKKRLDLLSEKYDQLFNEVQVLSRDLLILKSRM